MRAPAAIAALVVTLFVVPTAASASSVGHIRVAIDGAASFNNYPRSADRHGYVILQAWQADRMRALKAANPAVKVLVYKNLSFTSDSTNAGRSASGVFYSQANRDHPEWFLKNTSGARFTSWSFRWNWAMDTANAAYQRQWANTVLAELKADGWDGVFVDDVNPTMKYHYTPSQVAKYPTDAAYSAATRSALAGITPLIRNAGKRVVANIGAWPEYYSAGVSFLPYLDGAMDEMFLKWGNAKGQGYDAGRWQTQMNEMRETQSRGKDFIGITHSESNDAAAARYGYATMMLGTQGGRAHFALAQDYTNETWFPEYDYNLGKPLAAATKDANGVYRRRFERGMVVVNPTTETKSVSFGAAYRGSGIASPTRASMPSTSGLVLQNPPNQTPNQGAAKVPSVLAIVKGRGRVELRWTRGRHGVKAYRVARNGKVVRVTRGRRFTDRGVSAGRRYRYKVTALNRRGGRIGSSRAARVATPRRKRHARSSRVAVRQVVGSLAAARPAGWRHAFVERRVRAGGKLRWQRVTRVAKPLSSIKLAVRAPRTTMVRLVVRSVSGAGLRSTPFRLGSA